MNRFINIVGYTTIAFVVLMFISWGIGMKRVTSGASDDPQDAPERIHQSLAGEIDCLEIPFESVKRSWSNGFREHTYLYILEMRPTEAEAMANCLKTFSSPSEDSHFASTKRIGPSQPPEWWDAEMIDSHPYIFGFNDDRSWRATFIGSVCYLVISDH